jgi:hypothetical protein
MRRQFKDANERLREEEKMMTTYKDHSARAGETAGDRLTLAEILEIFAAGDELPLKFTAYDGSSAGPDDAELGLSRHCARRSGPGSRLRRG